jgi:hypothetical protein
MMARLTGFLSTFPNRDLCTYIVHTVYTALYVLENIPPASGITNSHLVVVGGGGAKSNGQI